MALVNLTKEKWDSLSPAEKALAKSLGISQPKNSGNPGPKIERQPRTTKLLRQYVLGIVTECLLCKEIEINYFEMKRREKGIDSYLEAIPSTTSLVPNKWEVRKTSCCRHCKNNLRYWDKTSLINKIISLSLSIKAYKQSSREGDLNGTAESSRSCEDSGQGIREEGRHGRRS